MADLKTKYEIEIRPALPAVLGFSNPAQAPRLMKIVINMGIKATDKDALKDLAADMGTFTGQKPAIVKSRKSISNFKLRAGMPIGIKVTLRGRRMYEFLDRLICAALPRIRDFRGLSADSFDRRGNYNFGVEDHTIFPEIDPDKVKQVHGMNVTMVTSARNDKEARELLVRFGLPLADDKK